MLAFRAHFRVSKERRLIVLILGLICVLTIVFSFSGSLKIVWCFAALLALCYAWREPIIIQTLLVDTQARASLIIHQETHSAQLLSGSLITPYLCILKWQVGEKVIWQSIWRDSVSPDEFRRVRVWAKFSRAH